MTEGDPVIKRDLEQQTSAIRVDRSLDRKPSQIS